jgi:AcrR family transcriptional regulator
VILAAARDQLAEGGFQAFGVNTVARRAGCDKQLIYRYYGGLEGLVDAIGRDLANWVDESLKPDGRVPPQSYRELMQRLLLAFIEALRSNLLVQKIAAWEIAEPSPLVARLAAARSMALASWLARQRGALEPPAGVDAPAINAFLIAAAQHLVLSSTSSGAFAGVPLQTESDWSRITNVITKMIDDSYGQPD